MGSDLFDEDHERFRASVRGLVDGQVVPQLPQWDADRLIDREICVPRANIVFWAWPRPRSSVGWRSGTTGIGW